jgi:hypothetical protein
MPALAGRRQGGILGEKAVPRMDRVHFFFARQRDDPLDLEVGFHRSLALADQVSFIGLEAMQRQAVFLRIDSHRAQAQLVGRAQNANGDFAAIECK